MHCLREQQALSRRLGSHMKGGRCCSPFKPSMLHERLSLSLSLSLPVYAVHLYVHVCTYTYTYINIHTHTCVSILPNWLFGISSSLETSVQLQRRPGNPSVLAPARTSWSSRRRTPGPRLGLPCSASLNQVALNASLSEPEPELPIRGLHEGVLMVGLLGFI